MTPEVADYCRILIQRNDTKSSTISEWGWPKRNVSVREAHELKLFNIWSCQMHTYIYTCDYAAIFPKCISIFKKKQINSEENENC